MKRKLSLTDSVCYSESIYVSFNLNKLMPLHLWPPLGGIHERKWRKAKKCLQLTIHTLQKTRAPCSRLEYCLKDSPCFTEWINVCYKCIRDLVWISMEPVHGYTACLYKRARNSYLSNGYKTKPSIIKRRFLPINAAISRLIDSSPSVMN